MFRYLCAEILVVLGSQITRWLNSLGQFAPQLGLRLLLAYEFWASGVQKFKGENWFGEIQDNFPFPFSLLPVGLNWSLATWTEILGSIALVLGLGTRFAVGALMILDVVAWASVHADNGYNVCENGFKLPLMYFIMFLPLLLSGPGKASLDHLIATGDLPLRRRGKQP